MLLSIVTCKFVFSILGGPFNQNPFENVIFSLKLQLRHFTSPINKTCLKSFFNFQILDQIPGHFETSSFFENLALKAFYVETSLWRGPFH